MSFDIFLLKHQHGEGRTFPTAIMDEVFADFIVHREETFVRVQYPDESEADIWYKVTEEEIDCVMFNHCVGEQFSDAMFELLKRIDGVICWPGGGCVVANQSAIDDMPPELIATFGTPIIVSSGNEISEVIEGS